MATVKPERYRPDVEDEGESFLAYYRKKRGLDQRTMAAAVGVSLRTYRRLERGDIDDPGVRLLHNCAYVLGRPLYDIIPAQWYHWTVFDDSKAEPPKWETIYDFNRSGSDPSLGFDLPRQLCDRFDDPFNWIGARRKALQKKWRKLAGASFG